MMTGGLQPDRAELTAALGWLVAAGVDTVVGEAPFAWLAPVGPIATPVDARAVAAPVIARAAIATINADSLSALAAALLESHPTALFADGTPGDAMVIGDRPTTADAAEGRIFADAAGALLDKMLVAIGRSRGDTYLANAVQWPGSGTATPAEAAASAPYLCRQITLARPKAILALGQAAATALTGSTAGINRQRGHWVEVEGVAVMPTFHPAHLLRHPAHKALAWADLCAFRARLA
jgi:uracil-DNA glycosylase family 4